MHIYLHPSNRSSSFRLTWAMPPLRSIYSYADTPNSPFPLYTNSTQRQFRYPMESFEVAIGLGSALVGNGSSEFSERSSGFCPVGWRRKGLVRNLKVRRTLALSFWPGSRWVYHCLAETRHGEVNRDLYDLKSYMWAKLNIKWVTYPKSMSPFSYLFRFQKVDNRYISKRIKIEQKTISLI